LSTQSITIYDWPFNDLERLAYRVHCSRAKTTWNEDFGRSSLRLQHFVLPLDAKFTSCALWIGALDASRFGFGFLADMTKFIENVESNIIADESMSIETMRLY
jgi:hypothetical protein